MTIFIYGGVSESERHRERDTEKERERESKVGKGGPRPESVRRRVPSRRNEGRENACKEKVLL